LGGIMPQEELTVKYFRHGCGTQQVANAQEFGGLIDHWMKTPGDYRQFRKKFLALRYEENPTVIIEELVNLGQSVAGTALSPRPFPPKPRAR